MECLQSDLLQRIPHLKHGFFYPGLNGDGGDNFSFKNGSQSNVFKARVQACGMIGVKTEHLTHVYQEHGNTIHVVNHNHVGMGAIDGEGQVGKGDAMITSEPGVPLAVVVADCLPIFFSTSQAEVIALVHAGWRGSLDGIGQRTALKIMNDYQFEPQDLLVWIGPGISRKHFEVGIEVIEQFEQKWSAYRHIIDHQNRKIDLKQLNQEQLLEIGLLPEQIDISPECTFANQRFFSYRRDGAGVGHNLAVIEKTSV